jgi:hypothetical protein
MNLNERLERILTFLFTLDRTAEENIKHYDVNLLFEAVIFVFLDLDL